ncbi:Golgi-associated plant pathogenesis-related protein 1 [Armadillidium vulgare]|nr:Golgi-associated plant pathogenesis-related protein 1 [Armadillidium vulgare]
MRRNEKGFAEPHFVERDESFVQAVLRACNFYRMTHNVVRLSLDKSLTEYAQEWAEQLALEDRLRPRPNNVYGENLYRSTFKINAELHGQEPVEYWYSTKKYHTFKDPADIRAAPFTQLIWSDSRDIGVGVAKSKSDRTYMVANFNPPGNLVGHFAEQVPPMKCK